MLKDEGKSAPSTENSTPPAEPSSRVSEKYLAELVGDDATVKRIFEIAASISGLLAHPTKAEHPFDINVNVTVNIAEHIGDSYESKRRDVHLDRRSFTGGDSTTVRGDGSAVVKSEVAMKRIKQTFNGAVGGVQTGDHNRQDITQNIGASTSDLLELVYSLRDNFRSDLGASETKEANELVDAVQAELEQPQPSNSKLKAFGLGLGKFLSDAGAAVLAEIISKACGIK